METEKCTIALGSKSCASPAGRMMGPRPERGEQKQKRDRERERDSAAPNVIMQVGRLG